MDEKEEEKEKVPKKASKKQKITASSQVLILQDVEKEEEANKVVIESQFPKLKEELDSWRAFTHSLREEDRNTYKEMIAKILSRYSEAIENSARGYTTESLLVSLILVQQKRIDWLSKQVSLLKENATEPLHKTTVDDEKEAPAASAFS